MRKFLLEAPKRNFSREFPVGETSQEEKKHLAAWMKRISKIEQAFKYLIFYIPVQHLCRLKSGVVSKIYDASNILYFCSVYTVQKSSK